MIWRARHRSWEFPRRTLLMGIVNVTPDSFSDGGCFLAHDAAVEQGLRLLGEGADLLDVGGESTRPGAEPVSIKEEIRRVVPVIRELSRISDSAISVDTMKPEVAAEAIGAGAVIVNDVAAASNGPAMWDVLKTSGAGYVCMHMKGTPADMQTAPEYDDVVGEVSRFFGDRLAAIEGWGIRADAVILDPGLGFGKTDSHNLQLLARMEAFRSWRRPLLLGASRKSFIGRTLGAPVENRVPASIACGLWAALHGAAVLRVHDVAETAQAIGMIEAIQAQGPVSC